VILDTATRSAQIVLGEAVTTTAPTICAFWADQISGTGGFLPGDTNTTTNGVTPVTIVAAPGTGIQRAVTEIRGYNADTVAHSFVLQLNDNSTIYVIDVATVQPGGTYTYLPGQPSSVAAAPAILLESGTTSEKISGLPDATALDGTELYVAVQAGADVQATGNDVGLLILTDAFAVSPLDAVGGSGDNGISVLIVAGTGDGTGSGGAVNLTAGNSGPSGGSGGALNLSAGAASYPGYGNIGGSVVVDAASSPGGGGVAGHVFVYGGVGNDIDGGGSILLRAGRTGLGALISGGGSLYGYAGSAYGTGASAVGGTLLFTAGNGNDVGSGGGISLRSGFGGNSAGNGGNIYIQPQGGGVGGNTGLLRLGNIPTTDPLFFGAMWDDNGALAFSENPTNIVNSTTSGGATPLTSGSAQGITQVTNVNAGNFWCFGVAYFTGASTTTLSQCAASVGVTVNVLETAPGQFGNQYLGGATMAAIGQDVAVVVSGFAVTLAATTTVYLNAQATFGVSTLSAYGQIALIPIL
jgi:hypothetical protein